MKKKKSYNIKNMKSGYINLFPIFEFIAKHPSGMRWRNTQLRPYGSLCSRLTESISKQSGWYFWGKFNAKSNWECIYIGKSEHTEKGWGLYHRIKDELKEERVAFWAYVVGEKKAFSDQSKAYQGRFDYAAKRALRKKGTHFLVWINDPTVTFEQVVAEEKALIGYYKPSSNIQRGRAKGTTKKTKQIINLVNKEIKKILSKK